MAIYIKNAKLPDNCYECPFNQCGDCYGGRIKYIMDIDDDEELYHTKRHPQCPLIEIPEPHGRLIDENTIMDVYYERVVHEDGKFKFPMIRIVGTDALTVIKRSE